MTDHAEIFTMILTGDVAPSMTLKDVDEAVAERARELIPNIREHTVEEDGGLGYIYGSRRTRPENLGWRFRQNGRIAEHGVLGEGDVAFNSQEILDGKHDELIEHTYHDAASSDYWYAYEKDWD